MDGLCATGGRATACSGKLMLFDPGQPIAQDLRERLPASAELVTYGMLLAIALALPLGTASTWTGSEPTPIRARSRWLRSEPLRK